MCIRDSLVHLVVRGIIKHDVIRNKTYDEGKLFGSITVRDIADACFSNGVEIEKSEIKLPDGPLRNTGEFEGGVQVHPDLIVKMKVMVSAEA